MGQLTTHVLDLSSGRPAANLRVDLLRLDGGERSRVSSHTTNPDGRCDAPLLDQVSIEPGEWELVFHVAAFYTAMGVEQSEPPFLNEVSIRFGIADREQNYHVPLLVTPWSYSTYRGS